MKNKEYIAMLNTLPMGLMTPQQSQHIKYGDHLPGHWILDISMVSQVAAQANNLTGKVK